MLPALLPLAPLTPALPYPPGLILLQHRSPSTTAPARGAPLGLLWSPRDTPHVQGRDPDAVCAQETGAQVMRACVTVCADDLGARVTVCAHMMVHVGEHM